MHILVHGLKAKQSILTPTQIETDQTFFVPNLSLSAFICGFKKGFYAKH